MKMNEMTYAHAVVKKLKIISSGKPRLNRRENRQYRIENGLWKGSPFVSGREYDYRP